MGKDVINNPILQVVLFTLFLIVFVAAVSA